MKITVTPSGFGFKAVSDQKDQVYFGGSETEALGEAIRNNIEYIPGLEIEIVPKTLAQLEFENRCRVTTISRGND